jgi:hypothetical protein
MEIKATTTVIELVNSIKKHFKTSVSIFTTKGNLAGEERKVRALTDMENITWPIQISVDDISKFLKVMKKEYGFDIRINDNDASEEKVTSVQKNSLSELKIKVSGPRKNFVFGSIKADVFKEIEKLITTMDDDLTVEEFLIYLLKTVTEKDDSLNNITSIKEWVEWDTKINDYNILGDLFDDIENAGSNVEMFYYLVFEKYNYVFFFEKDTMIKIESNGKAIYNNSLEKLTKGNKVKSGETLKDNAIALTNILKFKKNKDIICEKLIDLNENDEISDFCQISSDGVMLLDEVFPIELIELSKMSNLMTIIHNEEGYVLLTQEIENPFEFNKLVLSSLRGALDCNFFNFEKNNKYITSNFFYDGKLVKQDEGNIENIIGIEASTDKYHRLGFFING